ncbi:NfeD family protein [Novosphingobium sp. JCM 18896]|uniref:NfeD family protein n=1 Tax=Novosphingobium sp. JCM 18896 TaxID=2989731 RepID=UPI0022233730|nr:NfeD family protein [Novosphingobium sp. JCM 18896]MCW1431436.1 NfeD family protein [Novosphingobium sp. JCM 18896]
MEWFEALDAHWHWLAIGLVLAAAEMAIPGVFLIWLAGAALITGALTWALPLGIAMQVVIFAVLAIVSVFTGKRYLAANPIESADPKMNDRGARLVGETVVVTHAIDGGNGRVKQGDSEWLAKGPDAEPGTRMRVAGLDGVVLLVEHLH